jgi:hypothetical protein
MQGDDNCYKRKLINFPKIQDSRIISKTFLRSPTIF